MKAKRTKPARVYPAESDPRQAAGVDRFARDIQRIASSLRAAHADDSDPRQVIRSAVDGITYLRLRIGLDQDEREDLISFMSANTESALAREFGPWVRGADGRWQRDRRKR